MAYTCRHVTSTPTLIGALVRHISVYVTPFLCESASKGTRTYELPRVPKEAIRALGKLKRRFVHRLPTIILLREFEGEEQRRRDGMKLGYQVASVNGMDRCIQNKPIARMDQLLY